MIDYVVRPRGGVAERSKASASPTCFTGNRNGGSNPSPSANSTDCENCSGHGFKATMNTRRPRQLELFSDDARAVAAPGSSKPAPPNEAGLQAKLDAARMRIHEIVVLRMKTWLPEETLKGLCEVEVIRREQVRMHFQILEHVRTGAPSSPRS
jgi:hypothetical protein